MPSPVPDRPGLLIRDPYRYSDSVLIIPPALVECLRCFDGEQSELELREALVRATGDLQVADLQRSLTDALSHAGFLDDSAFEQLKSSRQREFAESLRREPAHAGTAYPAEAKAATDRLRRYLGRGRPAAGDSLLGIAAPHVSPEGGWQCYQAAYRVMGPAYRDRTFVVLGTSHYGEPERFGLTRKPFATPLGESAVDVPLVDRLAAQAEPAVRMEDYCHAVEHSIEFQVLFLQHLYGPGVRILPILCGPYARSIHQGGKPEQDESVRRFLDALGEMAAREGDRLFWVLGIDMAHIGRRYGDAFTAQAGRGELQAVQARDQGRIGRIEAADAAGFWDLVQENQDDLKWCGSSPLYTFLKAVPQARGKLLRYEQWNIDPQSVVSFAGMSFAAA